MGLLWFASLLFAVVLFQWRTKKEKRKKELNVLQDALKRNTDHNISHVTRAICAGAVESTGNVRRRSTFNVWNMSAILSFWTVTVAVFSAEVLHALPYSYYQVNFQFSMS